MNICQVQCGRTFLAYSLLTLAIFCALSFALTTPEAQAQKIPESTPPVAATDLATHLDALRNARDTRALVEAHRLDDELAMLDPVHARTLCIETAAKLEAAPTTEFRLLAAARLRRYAARVAHGLGDPASAQEQMRLTGAVDQWNIVGPFDNSNNAGFDIPYGPEGVLNPEASYDGKIAPVSWRPLVFTRRGYNKLVDAINPDRSVLVYAASVVQSPKAQKAVLRFGADGAYKIWVNGELVTRHDTDLGGTFDRDAYGVRLQKGNNLITLKVAGETRNNLGFFLRFTDTQGKALLLEANTSLPAGKLAASTKPSRGSFAVLSPTQAARKIADKTNLAQDLLSAAYLNKQHHYRDPETPWRDLADKAVALAPDQPEILADAAELLPQHWRRQELLRRAHQLAPKRVDILLSLARELDRNLGIGHDPEVFALVDKAIALSDTLAENRPGLEARLQKAKLLSNRGFHNQALAILQPLQKQYSFCDPLLKTLGAQYSSLGRELAEANIAQQRYKKRKSSSSIARKTARFALRSAQPNKALKILNDLLAVYPGSFRAVRLRADVLFQQNKAEEALASLATTLEHSPGLTMILNQRASILERLGRNEEAAQTYEEALAVNPEDRALLERIQSLRPEVASYEAPYRFGDQALVPAENAAQTHTGQDAYYLARQEVVHVTPSGRSSRFHQKIVHVLTEEGAKSWSFHRMYYSPGYERVELVSIRVRKKDGTISEAYARRDYDAGQGSGNLYYLRKYAYIEVPDLKPGDTVEYAWRESEVSKANFREGYFGDLWYFQSAVDTERARYVLLTPESMKIHTRAPNISSVQHETRKISYQNTAHTAHIFDAKGLKRIQTDRDMPGRAEVYEYVLVSTYKTWQEVGKWWWNLIKEQLVIDDEIQTLVREITRGLRGKRAKVEAIHRWVVKNTRYVGIEFGVHGWKPYRTTLCVRRKFGDCKDKASLIKVMLNAAGIKADLVLIRTRTLGQVDPSPANLAIFNHAIAYVPEFDLFLDGTAEFHGTRELPYSDQGQISLIVSDGGGATLRTTPLDKPEDNHFLRILDVDLRGENPKVSGEMRATGSDAAYYRRKFDSEEQRESTLERILARVFPGAKLLSSDFTEVKSIEKEVRIGFTFEGGSFVKESGDVQYIFPSGRPIRMLDNFAPQATRNQDLVLGVPYKISYQLTYKLSDNIKPTLPQTRTDKGSFGSYELRTSRKGNVVTVDISYSLATDRVSTQNYTAFRTWLGELDNALNQPILLEFSQE